VSVILRRGSSFLPRALPQATGSCARFRIFRLQSVTMRKRSRFRPLSAARHQVRSRGSAALFVEREITRRTQGTRTYSRKPTRLLANSNNNSFEDALYCSAQVAYDVRFKGAVVTFSWRSADEMISYEVDQKQCPLEHR